MIENITVDPITGFPVLPSDYWPVPPAAKPSGMPRDYLRRMRPEGMMAEALDGARGLLLNVAARFERGPQRAEFLTRCAELCDELAAGKANT